MALQLKLLFSITVGLLRLTFVFPVNDAHYRQDNKQYDPENSGQY